MEKMVKAASFAAAFQRRASYDAMSGEASVASSGASSGGSDNTSLSNRPTQYAQFMPTQDDLQLKATACSLSPVGVEEDISPPKLTITEEDAMMDSDDESQWEAASPSPTSQAKSGCFPTVDDLTQSAIFTKLPPLYTIHSERATRSVVPATNAGASSKQQQSEEPKAFDPSTIVPPSFICSICDDVICNAVTLSCGCKASTVCSGCWQQQTQEYCRSCSKIVDTVVPCLALDQTIDCLLPSLLQSKLDNPAVQLWNQRYERRKQQQQPSPVQETPSDGFTVVRKATLHRNSSLPNLRGRSNSDSHIPAAPKRSSTPSALQRNVSFNAALSTNPRQVILSPKVLQKPAAKAFQNEAFPDLFAMSAPTVRKPPAFGGDISQLFSKQVLQQEFGVDPDARESGAIALVPLKDHDGKTPAVDGGSAEADDIVTDEEDLMISRHGEEDEEDEDATIFSGGTFTQVEQPKPKQMTYHDFLVSDDELEEAEQSKSSNDSKKSSRSTKPKRRSQELSEDTKKSLLKDIRTPQSSNAGLRSRRNGKRAGVSPKERRQRGPSATRSSSKRRSIKSRSAADNDGKTGTQKPSSQRSGIVVKAKDELAISTHTAPVSGAQRRTSRRKPQVAERNNRARRRSRSNSATPATEDPKQRKRPTKKDRAPMLTRQASMPQFSDSVKEIWEQLEGLDAAIQQNELLSRKPAPDSPDSSVSSHRLRPSQEMTELLEKLSVHSKSSSRRTRRSTIRGRSARPKLVKAFSESSLHRRTIDGET